jgi:hypothetical protein
LAHRRNLLCIIIRKGYKFILNTRLADEALCRPLVGYNRIIWNKALSLKKERLASKQSCLSFDRLPELTHPSISCKLFGSTKEEHLKKDADSGNHP